MTRNEEIKLKREITKRDRFHKIASQRTNNILNSLRLLGNCSNKSNYEYTQDEVQQMFDAIEEALKSAKQKYSHAEEKKSFRFKEE